MIEPHVHLAYAARGAGVLCAMFWFPEKNDVYGWFTGARAHEHPARFFALQHYYATRDTECYLSAEDDLYGEWRMAVKTGTSRIDRPIPVPAELCPELDRIQDAFVQEWLVFETDPLHDQEEAALRAHELPVFALNIRASRINKLTHEGPVWTYWTPGADIHVVDYLSQRWPLDYLLE
ncbi:MAG: hypothetical protein A3I01_11945 [Betaproteobacteria bacterium RIFCSPLOWO2_02_FULL_65_24]|nr:MAG: hypothetical protein A3I01_11945 [Betaproteobacteria bacterium RIFCSPLOWO2_02_FULL_65_24]OGA97041.1 MAG: hypothetical protein A3G27_09630 [Betaproteobacteria bacterium RIFCSPLOWO2_12_FULL_66_14]